MWLCVLEIVSWAFGYLRYMKIMKDFSHANTSISVCHLACFSHLLSPIDSENLVKNTRKGPSQMVFVYRFLQDTTHLPKPDHLDFVHQCSDWDSNAVVHSWFEMCHAQIRTSAFSSVAFYCQVHPHRLSQRNPVLWGSLLGSGVSFIIALNTLDW